MDNFVTSNDNNNRYMEPPIYRKENMDTVSKLLGIQHSTNDKIIPQISKKYVTQCRQGQCIPIFVLCNL